MRVTPTEIPDVRIFEPEVLPDERGFFTEIFQAKRYATCGLQNPFVQDNFSRSNKSVVRGLHMQLSPPQGKLVTVLRGRIFDVAVDLRRNSPTFAKHVVVELSDDNLRQMWVPRGFAHGFAVLSETADVFYKCDNFYNPNDEIAVRWNDPQIGIVWPISKPHLSRRDSSAVMLKDIDILPLYGAV
ncbi:MAG: dTDP-4-dehydrorhamnose 3,5-epimerase [Afipia sp.]|nr:dTDP-4-dehydrorhamnose 3,5-epimerase [Afipia sp.]